MPPPDVASGRTEAGILDQHRNGTGNLQMTIAPLRWAATLAGRRRAQSQHSGESDALATADSVCCRLFAKLALIASFSSSNSRSHRY